MVLCQGPSDGTGTRCASGSRPCVLDVANIALLEFTVNPSGFTGSRKLRDIQKLACPTVG
jgi:hypothetical protein